LKPSFTLFELVIVIIIIAILSAVISISIPNNKLQNAVDSLERYIDYTHSLALKDDKYNFTTQYWYKRWWKISISATKNGQYFFEVFSDMNLNGNDDVNEIAKDPLTGKYLKGNYPASTASSDCNLSKFNIKLVKFKYNGIESTITSNKRLNLYFDNYGNVYKKLYNNQIFKKTSTLGSNILISNLEIKLCTNNKCDNNDTCKAIVITPTGYIYQTACY